MDKLSKKKRSACMRAVKSRNTAPEKIIRKLAYRLGYRFRLHKKDLPGKPDLTFMSRRAVIFVNGCFWHCHTCKRGKSRPKTNIDFWTSKLALNVKRDAQQQSILKNNGWRVLVIWECQLKNERKLIIKIRRFLDESAV